MKKNKRVIDISKWNPVISFNKIKEDVDGVIVRLGYRGNTTGTLTYDKEFVNNINGLIAHDIPIGIYWFTNAINANEGIEEANFVINTIEKMNLKLSFPIMIDTEYGNKNHTGRADNIDNESRTEAIIAFLETIKTAGYNGAIYAADSWFRYKLVYNKIKNYMKWVARYSSEEPTIKDNLIGWQKTSSGSCPGIKDRVDINEWYIDISESSFIYTEEKSVKEPAKEVSKKPVKNNKTVKLDDGMKIELKNTPLYSSSTTDKIAARKSGTFYIWNKSKRNGRVRITTKFSYVKELGKITGWVNVSDIM